MRQRSRRGAYIYKRTKKEREGEKERVERQGAKIENPVGQWHPRKGIRGAGRDGGRGLASPLCTCLYTRGSVAWYFRLEIRSGMLLSAVV